MPRLGLHTPLADTCQIRYVEDNSLIIKYWAVSIIKVSDFYEN